MAERNDSRIGREKVVCACAMNDLRSVLEIPPIWEKFSRTLVRNVGTASGILTGLRSALEQSYFVYPSHPAYECGKSRGNTAKGLPDNHEDSFLRQPLTPV